MVVNCTIFLLRLLVLCILVPMYGCSQINNKEFIVDDENLNLKLLNFSKASDFFFSTLSENFQGNRGDNFYDLIRILSKNIEEPEDFFRLQVDARKFEALNTEILENIYGDYFPIHVYKYGTGTATNILEKHIISEKSDTLEVIIPSKLPCPIPRNSLFQGNFKDSFRELVLRDTMASIVKDEIMVYLRFDTFQFSILDFSIDTLAKYDADKLKSVYEDKFNRILVSLIFWEYLSHCANYDLNTRKYFYEE